MKILYKILMPVMGLTLALSACTEPEENIGWVPGTNLRINGPTEAVVADTNRYYVHGFTIDETYTWTLDGDQVTSIREGEYVHLVFDEPGAHTLTVDNGTLDGELDIVVVAADAP